MARRIARVDGNQAEIVKNLRNTDYHITHIHTIGSGVPDLIVTGIGKQSKRLLALLVEVKQLKGKLTEDEIEWHSKFPPDGPLIVAYSADDIVEWFNQN